MVVIGGLGAGRQRTSGNGAPSSGDASASAWSRTSAGHPAIWACSRAASFAKSARDASSKPGMSPAIADMK
ncbi:hypothetical protein Y030_5949 [Burkholderia pseudomallei MSHR332]|nr:hypothetical protein Y030_5949 [Burkholderia pseudomallei MSHR332]